MTEPVPLLTVGDLNSELSRWSNETPVTFRSPLKEQEFRFYRYSPGDNLPVLEPPEVLLRPSAGTKRPLAGCLCGAGGVHAGFAGYSGR